MTKKEAAALQAQLENLKKELVLARALRWTDADETPDLPAPVPGSGEITVGWVFRHCSWGPGGGFVLPACSSSVTHQVDATSAEEFMSRARGSHSQNGIPLFSTRVRALRALRRSVERQAAADLALIDYKLAQDDLAGLD